MASLWKDAKISLAAKKDQDYIFLCPRCSNEIGVVGEEFHNSTSENPIICSNCGHQCWALFKKEELEDLTS